MSSRFGYDFSRVRIHTNRKAAESARAVNAQAYTVGKDVVLGSESHTMQTSEGNMLLAHELVHVVQQGSHTSKGYSSSVILENNEAETEADDLARRAMSDRVSIASYGRRVPVLQRRVKVRRPRSNIPNPTGRGLVQTNAATANQYLTSICPAGSVTTNAATGAVNMNSAFCTQPTAMPPGAAGPAPTRAMISTHPTGCSCLCDMVSSSHDWHIEIDDSAWPHTDFDNRDAANGIIPGGSGGTVFAPSPNNRRLYGAATVSGRALNVDPWLVLGHELCGHAWPGDSGAHGPNVAKPRGEGGHQLAVRRENQLRAEHGIELRGTYKDPNCGESFWRNRTRPGRVIWSSFRAVCESWRNAYNRRHGTRYRITDRIP